MLKTCKIYREPENLVFKKENLFINYERLKANIFIK